MLPLLFTLLAQSPPVPADNSAVIFAGIVAVLGGVGTIVGHMSGKRAGRAESIEIKGQPLLVRMAEEFVTRREFERLETSMTVNVSEMKGLFAQTMQAMEMRDKTLSAKIERLGERVTKDLRESNASHQEARGRIHQKVNDHGEDIAALQREVSISRSLGEFGEAIRETIEASKQKSHEG